jgi:hypothetical protein
MVQPLFQEALPRRAWCNGKVFMILAFLYGCSLGAVLTTMLIGGNAHRAVEEPTINMAYQPLRASKTQGPYGNGLRIVQPATPQMLPQSSMMQPPAPGRNSIIAAAKVGKPIYPSKEDKKAAAPGEYFIVPPANPDTEWNLSANAVVVQIAVLLLAPFFFYLLNMVSS